MPMKQGTNMAVVVVPFPMQGHLTPLLRLSRRIAAGKVPVHYIGSTVAVRQAISRSDVEWSRRETKYFHTYTFHKPPFPNFSPNSNSRYPSHLIPMITATILAFNDPLFSLVKYLAKEYPFVVVIFDALMASTVQCSLHSIPNVQFYAFETSSACSVFFDEMMRELPSTEGCYTPEFKEFVDFQYEFRDFLSGTIFNSCTLTEGFYLDLLKKIPSFAMDKKIWALGPVNPADEFEMSSSLTGDSRCVKWIHDQPENSVLLVSFGTASSLSDEQIEELALGLERSGVRFVWLLRQADRGDVFAGQVSRIELPLGFEERVRERGMVVREWESQFEILINGIGGFLTNCGWNSCMESITAGVPIVAWPMHSDQPANAVLMTMVLRIGFQIRRWRQRDEEVSSFAVEAAVKKLMASVEGRVMRKRAKTLSRSVASVCYLETESFIEYIKAFH